MTPAFLFHILFHAKYCICCLEKKICLKKQQFCWKWQFLCILRSRRARLALFRVLAEPTSWAVLRACPALCFCLFPPWSCVKEAVCPKGELGELIWLKSNYFCQIIPIIISQLNQGLYPWRRGADMRSNTWSSAQWAARCANCVKVLLS